MPISLNDDNFFNAYYNALAAATIILDTVECENKYFEENFGLRCSDFTFIKFEIVDEKKYTEFLLRYS